VPSARVVVFGSNSFAGGDFVDLLLETGRYDVLGISRSPEKIPALRAYAGRPRDRFTFRQADLNRGGPDVEDALAAFEPEFAVNFAAQGDDVASWMHPRDFFATNCTALAGLVERFTARPGLRRFLQISSSSVYPNVPGVSSEETPVAPGSPYGVSKAAADLLLLAFHARTGFPSQIVRPPNIYGPYQDLFRIIPKSIVALKRGQQIELHGGGHAVRAYLHVRDASRAVLAVLERGAAGEIYNVAPDAEYSIREIVATVCELLGCDFATSTHDAGDRIAQQSGMLLDSSKIRTALGWSPAVTLRDGIAGVKAWIEREWDELAREPVAYAHKT
jgi:dTDP-glucose 4,6-dehydratase